MIVRTKYNQLHIIIGVINDKDLTEIPLFPMKRCVLKINIPRGLDAKLKKKQVNFNSKGNVFNSVTEANKQPLLMQARRFYCL
jgi:dihydrofolate synthase/folylpolyglutamate synthase